MLFAHIWFKKAEMALPCFCGIFHIDLSLYYDCLKGIFARKIYLVTRTGEHTQICMYFMSMNPQINKNAYSTEYKVLSGIVAK